MSVSWPDILVHHPAKHADSTVRAARGMASDKEATEKARATGVLYSPSSPRHAPLAAAHAHRPRQESSGAHESRSATTGQTNERSAQQSAQGPEEIARRALQRKLSNLGPADSGARSTPESGASERLKSKVYTSKQSKSSRRDREPKAAPRREEQPRRAADTPMRRAASPPRKNKKSRVYCGNNRKAEVLLNGSERIGRPSECIQRGFGAALHQPVEDVEAFVRMHGGPYEKLIDPQLWYKNKDPPHGMQRASLPMCFQKGWGAGTAALARKLREEHGLHSI